MLYSKSAHAAGGSGFFLEEDKNAPSDAITVSKSDASTAANLPVGSTYDFDNNGKLVVYLAPVQTPEEIKANTAAIKWCAICVMQAFPLRCPTLRAPLSATTCSTR